MYTRCLSRRRRLKRREEASELLQRTHTQDKRTQHAPTIYYCSSTFLFACVHGAKIHETTCHLCPSAVKCSWWDGTDSSSSLAGAPSPAAAATATRERSSSVERLDVLEVDAPSPSPPVVSIPLEGGGKAGGSGVARPRCRLREGPPSTVLSERGRALLRRGVEAKPGTIKVGGGDRECFRCQVATFDCQAIAPWGRGALFWRDATCASVCSRVAGPTDTRAVRGWVAGLRT